MNPVNIIVKKRDGDRLTAQEIRYFIKGYVAGQIPDYQAAALAMAIYFQGMSAQETADLTLAMAASGDQIDLHAVLPAGTIVVDKHSSGGVGDKTTLVVGPIVAACGLMVGKMSGRGLSFSGGTIDKLESIAGWSPDLELDRFLHQMQAVGLVVAGQTADLAPADKKLYALRDVTGTVNSLPLIASSIMSKKLASGADAIVLDVKCGRGSFMETLDEARKLASLMVDIGTLGGRRIVALVTQMEQPLGYAAGNSLEVKEAIAALHGESAPDFRALVESVAVEMLLLGASAGESLDEERALAKIRSVIDSGAAFELFRAFVAAQGGDVAMVDNPDLLPTAPVVLPVPAPMDGYVGRIDARCIGLTVVDMGGGRRRKEDIIDHRVGVTLAAKVGDHVVKDRPLCFVHGADEVTALAAVRRVMQAFELQTTRPQPLSTVLARFSS